MTKKDYEFLAESLSKYYPGVNVAPYLADDLEKQYPNFNKAKFLKACGVSDE